MTQADTLRTVAILKALADEMRLGIVKDVARHEGSVSSCDIVKACAKRAALSQPAISHHFHRLVAAQILLIEKCGTQNRYRLNAAYVRQHGIDITQM